jgi:hypothetical protein
LELPLRNIVIVKFAGSFHTFNEAAEDEHLLNLGAREGVQVAIDAVFEGIEWNEAGWGEWRGGGGAVTFDVGSDDPVETLVVQVAPGTDADSRILTLCKSNDWHATDSGMGEFIDLEA